MKLPNHIVQNIFYRLGLDAEPVKSSSIFVHKAKCPLCEDHTQRLYLREYGSFYSVKCHNCGYSGNFESFLRENYPTEYEELRPFIINSIKDGSIFQKRTSKKEEKPDNENLNDLIDIRLKMYLKNHAFPVNVKQDNAKKEELRKRVINYLEGRRIPKSIYNDFVCVTKGPLRGYIGIPFFDEHKQNMIHLQGRLFVELNKEEKQPKYMFLRDKLDGIELESKQLWGLWRTNPNKPVIICEGTLDACAFENGIATCGATVGENYIQEIQQKYPNRIWCIDSFWSDKEGRKLTIKLLKMGERCFILPRTSLIKDANELLCKKLTTEYITDDVIEENTYFGRFGLIKLRTMEVTSVGS